jgi:hypothetical protein
VGAQSTEILYIDVNASIPLYNVSSTWLSNSFTVKIGMEQRHTTKIPATALIDSGAASSFIHPNTVKQHGLRTLKLPNKIRVFNADGTENKSGAITHFVKIRISIGDHKSWQSLYIGNIGKHSIIIGYNYLCQHNPEIHWEDKNIRFTRCPIECRP